MKDFSVGDILAVAILPFLLCLTSCRAPESSSALPPAKALSTRSVAVVPTPDAQNYSGLDSALWMSQSAEWRAACTQTYRLATIELDKALRDSRWTAAVEQSGEFAALPTAVIFDIDETLFDNSPYDALMEKTGEEYDPASFARWNESGRIRALSGSLAFAQNAAKRGVTLFYITNRSAEEKAVTLRNLQRLGFPVRSDEHLLLKNERAEWTGDKTFRRAFVAKRFRVLLLVGDDFNDFLSAPATATPAQRLQLKARYNANWGTKWIILPNPAYGSWERSETQGEKGAAALRNKIEALDTASAPAAAPKN